MPAPADKVGVAGQGTTDGEITGATSNTGAAVIVPASGSFVASPSQAARGSKITFTEKLTTARLLQAYLLDSLVIRQPGTAFIWTVVNGALQSSPMAGNVAFNLTNVKITPTPSGEVEVSFDLTPNTCADKAICLLNTTDAQSSLPTNFEADVTIKAYVAVSPGVLQFESLSLTTPFSVVGTPLVYVPAPDGKTGVVDQGIIPQQIDGATVNTGSPIATLGTLKPEKRNNSAGKPVKFTQKLKSDRVLQGFLLNGLVVKKPSTGESWTLVAGSQKREPMATAVGFSLNGVTIASSGQGDVEVTFEITPNVCSDSVACLLSLEDTQSLETLFEVEAEVKAFAYPAGQVSGALEVETLKQSSEFVVNGIPVVYKPAPDELMGVAAEGTTSGQLNGAKVSAGKAILTPPGTLIPAKPSGVIGDSVEFTSTVQHKRLLKAYLLRGLVVKQKGTPYLWPLIKDGKVTSVGTGMQFSLDDVEIVANQEGSVEAKWDIKGNVCNVKAQCLMSIPESQDATVIGYDVELDIRAFADGLSGLEYEDLKQLGAFSLSGVAVTTTRISTTTLVIPTTGFTFDATSNIAMNTLIDGQDVAQATALPSATATRIVSAAITQLKMLPISTVLAAPTPIIFQAIYDAVQDSRPLLGAQIRQLTVSRVEAPIRSFPLVSNGVVQQLGKDLMFESLVTINPDGSDGVAFMWINANQSILGTGALVADITMRWFVEAVQVKRDIPLAYVQLRRIAKFNLNGATSRTTQTQSGKTRSTKMTSSTKQTSVKTTTRGPAPTNWILAQTCKPGGKYDNAKNCCCAPNVTRRVTKTVTVKKSAKATGLPKRQVDEMDGLVTKEDVFARQVLPAHLCQVCPLARPQERVVCCLPKQTVTRVVKTLTKTRA